MMAHHRLERVLVLVVSFCSPLLRLPVPGTYIGLVPGNLTMILLSVPGQFDRSQEVSGVYHRILQVKLF